MPSELDERPYKLYRAGPRGLMSRLRGEEDLVAFSGPGGPGERRPGPGTGRRWRLPRRVRPLRILLAIIAFIVFWLALSTVLFMISSGQEEGLPPDAMAALHSGSSMLFSTDTVLIVGTDQRPRTGPGSKEPGSNYSDTGSRSDTIMLWRIGGGVSRRLSIPRDTAVDIPGHGMDKINAAYAIGGPALTIKTVERFTGVPINHMIIVNLAAFPPFINAIGGVDVKTGRVCSDISGGARNGGFSLYLSPGVHHLNGLQALVYARTRENKCNPHDNDLTRVQHQQQILNAIKAKLLSPGTFFHLPWAAWAAPKVLRTDMGGPTLMSLFIASELGGSAPVQVLKPTGGEVLPNGGDALTVTPQAVHAAVARLLNG
ncbi:MAG TPA: LCP family protein [Solirubrobacteraceae bacterium]|nr:LCP family protein [Solirubrobacteraceae bacterium]